MHANSPSTQTPGGRTAFTVRWRFTQQQGTAGSAFTLVEMLVTLTVIMILLGLLAPAIAHVEERSRRTVCVHNLRQMISGALMYAHDDSHGALSPSLGDSRDVLAFLYPQYVPALRTFICPSTENFIRPDLYATNPVTNERELYDLTGYAGTTTNAGASYELFGFMNTTADTPNHTELVVRGRSLRVKGVKKTLSTTDSYRHIYDTFALKGVVPGPSQIWLVLDGDDTGANNFPDESNNHGADGGNVSFCDGHAEWIGKKQYIFRYEFSQDENRR